MQDSRDQVARFKDGVAEHLRSETGVPAESRKALIRVTGGLLQRMQGDFPRCLGIAGAPGCGKSTLASALAHGLTEIGRPTLALSLDDYYLPIERREHLAATHHPLFRQRGVPGTHELDRLMEHLDRLIDGRAEGLELPRFDKSTDNRAPRDRWRRLGKEPEIILLEGWCIGAPPPAAAEWEAAVEAAVAIDDANGCWRRRVHYSWTDYHRALERRLDELWYIRVPDWNCVVDWRWQQECELESKNLGSRDEVGQFLALFEPIVQYMQHTHRSWADLTIAADRDHGMHLTEHCETAF